MKRFTIAMLLLCILALPLSSQFVPVGSGSGGSTLPVADTTEVVKGSADATKLVRIEADGLTTGTTRVITMPDANTTLPVASQVLTFFGPTAARTITIPDAAFTVARTDAAQTFTGAQTFTTLAVGFDIRSGATIYGGWQTYGLDLNHSLGGTTGYLLWSSNGGGSGYDIVFGRRDAGRLQLGIPAAVTGTRGFVGHSSRGGTDTDAAGGATTLSGGLGTGTGAGGNVSLQTAPALATGTTQNVALDRVIVVAKGKALSDAAAVSLFEIALPALGMTGGKIIATIRVTDGTDMQSFTQEIAYSAVNKAGVYTKSITASAGDKSVSAGTLTTSWSLLDGTNKVTVQLNADTSLVPSGTNSFVVYYTITNNSEQAVTVL